MLKLYTCIRVKYSFSNVFERYKSRKQTRKIVTNRLLTLDLSHFYSKHLQKKKKNRLIY